MKKTNGFTLIELLISISIIAILSVFLSVSFSNAQKDGRDQRRISDLKTIQNAAEQVMLLSGSYPPNAWYDANDKWTLPSNYVVLERFPNDPKGGVSYIKNSSNNNGYCICATVENTSKNSNALLSDCSDMVNTGSYFCIKNQQ